MNAPLSAWAMFATGCVLGLSAGISPGPLLALVMSESLAFGPRGGLKVAAAPLLTDIPIIAACALFLAAVPWRGPALAVLTLAGSVFLLLLAWQSFLIRPLGNGLGTGPGHSLRKAVLANFLNPHPYLFWLTVGMPIMAQSWARGLAPAAAFLAGFYVCIVGSKSVLAVLAGRSRGLLSGPAYIWANRVLGASLVVFALLLARRAVVFSGLP